jgi:hypothetical protein
MIDNKYINKLRIKSLDKNSLDHDSLYQNVSEQDERYFEYYIQHKHCLQCGKDHRFRPSLDGVQSSIDHTSELIALFFLG